jgi:hypothetical protein
MGLKNSNEASFEHPHGDEISTTARWDVPSAARVATSGLDTDVERAWELRARSRWVRDDSGPLNGFRWLLWDRLQIGRPPSRVEERPRADLGSAETVQPELSVRPLRLVDIESGQPPRSRPIG